MHGLDLWEARPRGEAFRAPSWRHSPRVAPPTAKACDLHDAAPCTGSICRSPDLGAKLWHRAGVIRRGSRLLQKKGCDLYNAALCTGWICGSPDLGAKLWHRAGAIRRGSRLPQKKRATCTTQRHAWTRFVGAPTRGEASGAALAPFAAGRGSHRKSVRPAQRSAMHGLDLWEARPRGEASGAALAPFAAGRASHRGSGVFCCLWAVRPRGEALSDRAAHANAGSSAGRTRSAHSPASCVRRACRRRGCVRFRADAPAHGRRSFAGTPVPLP